MRDWADLGELIDAGVEVHFVKDGLDLASRGGRLSADIQAVVAADFIRNLRDETRKGFYGRLRQGIYPLRAPVGYLDAGKGKPKLVDPIHGPQVQRAFEMYASGDWNFELLGEELYRMGLRGKANNRISKNGLTTILNNPFYFGVIALRKTGEVFEGAHKPLISKSLYDQAQLVLRGRSVGRKRQINDFLLRKLIVCPRCKLHAVGEKHKGRYVYYRCHGPTCHGNCISERLAIRTVAAEVASLSLSSEELGDLEDLIKEYAATKDERRLEYKAAVKLQLDQVDARLNRLTDAVIEGIIDKPDFERRKAELLMQKASHSDAMNIQPDAILAKAKEKLELLKIAQIGLSNVIPGDCRKFLSEITSNFLINGNSVELTMRFPYREIANLNASRDCDLQRDGTRTTDIRAVFELILKAAEQEANEPGLLSDDQDTRLAA